MDIKLVLIVAVFLLIVGLMVADKLNAVVALPLMAVALCLVAGVPFNTVVNTVIGGGISGLSGTIFTTLLAAILGEIIKKTGIAEKIIRGAAELGGDNPYVIAVICFLACAFCFFGLSGGGARFMLGMIAFPIMLSVGVPKVITGFVMLAGTSVGYFMNIARWTFIGNLVGLEATDPLVKETATMLMIPAVIISIALIIVGIKVKGPVFSWAASKESGDKSKGAPLISLITPVLPLILVLCLGWNVNAAIIFGIIYGLVTTQWKSKFKGVFDLLNQSACDGFSGVGVTIVLMMGIGMVLAAAKQEALLGPITTLLTNVVPTKVFPVILLFGVAGPFLCMYRGPLNPWGLGAALMGILLTTSLPIGLIVCLAWLYDYYVAVNDPTASQITWTCGNLQISVGKYTRGTCLVDAFYVLVGVILAVVVYMI